MVFKKLEAIYNGQMYQIEEDYPEIGVYLYVFKKDKCIEDYLQDNIEECKLFALEMYGVPIDIWVIKK